jgi:hypothetical protein
VPKRQKRKFDNLVELSDSEKRSSLSKPLHPNESRQKKPTRFSKSLLEVSKLANSSLDSLATSSFQLEDPPKFLLLSKLPISTLVNEFSTLPLSSTRLIQPSLPFFLHRILPLPVPFVSPSSEEDSRRLNVSSLFVANSLPSYLS